MLVLSRRPDESIVFPNLGITVQVVRLNRTQCRIAIDAPKEIQVLRGELVGQLPSASSPAVRKVTPLMRARLVEATDALQRLHEIVESCAWREAKPLVFSLFRELKRIEEELPARTPGPGKRQALLVDDNENEARLLASYLRLKDFDVETAQNGADAMHYLTSHSVPKVMLLDMQMPRFDGRWTVNEVRKNPKYDGLRIFAVSGLHPQEYGVELGRNGVDRWFRKPLNPEELIREITNGMEEDLVSGA